MSKECIHFFGPLCISLYRTNTLPRFLHVVLCCKQTVILNVYTPFKPDFFSEQKILLTLARKDTTDKYL